jgi:hypothetical protein
MELIPDAAARERARRVRTEKGVGPGLKLRPGA